MISSQYGKDSAVACPRVENAEHVQMAIRKIHGQHLHEQTLKCVFTDVCFNTSKAMTMDADRRTTKITYYIGLQRPTQNGEAPVLFPESIFCCRQ